MGFGHWTGNTDSKMAPEGEPIKERPMPYCVSVCWLSLDSKTVFSDCRVCTFKVDGEHFRMVLP